MSAAEFSKTNIQNIHALTPLQEGMLFHALLQPDSRAYLERTRYHLSGVLDEAAFRAAWSGVVQRHDILRSVFVHKNVPEPLQLVLKQRALDYEFTDLSSLSSSEQSAQLAACWQAQEQQPFDLSRDRLMRIRVFRLSADSHEVIWVYHHILLDGWSLAIIHQDFLELYQAAVAHRVPQLPAPISFSLYAKWLRGRDATASKAFWKSYLSGYTQTVGLPRNDQSASGTFTAGQHEFALSATVSNALRQTAIRQKVTLNTILQTLWGWALAAVTGRNDVVFAATVSGRPPEIPGVERMVGLLINAVPVRVQWSVAQTCSEVWARVQSEATAAKAHHHASLADIQSASSLGSALFDHILVFENYPVGENATDAQPALVMDSFEHADHTNYDLTVQLLPDEAIGFRFLYNRLAYAEDLFPCVQSALEIIAESITQSETPSLTELLQQPRLFELFPGSTQTPPAEVNDVYLLGSFTLDPLASVLAGWFKKFAVDLPVTLGPYHQVFQEVVAANSHYARNRAVNVLCIRWEDWLRDGYPDSPAELAQSLQRNLDDLLHALEQRSGPSTWVVSLPSSTASQPAWVRAELDKLDTAWHAALGKLSGLRHLDLRSLATRYGLTEVFDAQTDHAAHLPYTEAAYAAIATELARAVIAGLKSPFKVIAVDCDNTLWWGVAAEDGATTVGIDGGFLALQEFLLRKVGEGFLIVLCSKNNEVDVWEVFERHEGMRLRREHVTAQRINWQPKSANLRELARELNVGLDSFVFLDDSENECAEVAANAPEVLSLRLPPNPDARADFLEHLWALDKFQVTQEDRTRTQLYQQERARQQAQQSAGSLDDFIRSLDIRITISPVAAAEFERVAQLIQRTNQFNLSTIRRTTAELRAWLTEPHRSAWVVRVQDRFGNYGLSGVLLTEQRTHTLYVDTWLLSCRVLGRRVEHALQLALQAHACSLGCASIIALFRHSDKNAPARDFLQQYGWQLTSTAGDDQFYEQPVPSVGVELPEVHWQLLTQPFVETEPAPVQTTPTAHAIEVATNSSIATTTITWEAFIPDSPAGPHRAYYEALRCHDERALLSLLQEKGAVSSTARASVPPENPTEQALFTIWKELLGRDDFGVTDNFFALGGHSLKATRMLSRVFKALERELQLMDIFEHPTIRGLAQRIAARAGATFPAIPRLAAAPHYALSHAQRRMWTLHQMEQHSIAYNTTGFYCLTGALDVAAFTRALNLVVQRHESLRTTYRLVDDEPRQHIQSSNTFAVEFLDWSQNLHSADGNQVGHLDEDLSWRENAQDRAAGILPAVPEAKLRTFAEALSRQPIDLEQGPLFIAKLVRFAPQSHLFALHLHHIVSDGWAMEILERETLAAYEAIQAGREVRLPSHPLQYRDYSAWQNSELQQSAMTEHRQYWQQQFAGELKPLDLPTDRPRPSVQTFHGSTLRFTLERPLWQRLKDITQAERTTPFVTLIALIKTLLHRYTGQTDIIVGTVTAGRDHPDLENLIGLVANTVALRDSISPQSSFLMLLRQITRTVQDAFAHQALPFDVLLESLDWKRDISRSPLFDVMVVLQNQTSAAVLQAGLQIEEWNFAAPISRFDLTFNAAEVDGQLCIDLVYNTELFRVERMQRLAAHFQTLVQAVSQQPQCNLATVPILTADEVAHLAQISSRLTGYPRYDGTIIDAFEQQVAATPAVTALRHGHCSLSYRELDNSANRIAAFLLTQPFAITEQPIAVMLRDKSQVIATLLGIMKAGAAYLPIDPDYPAARIQYLLSDSRAPLLLVDEPTADLVNLPVDLRVVPIGECLGTDPSAVIASRPRPEDVAYIIYTSGSTGKPKGVQVEHRGFVNMTRQQIEVFDVTPSDRVIQFASLSFDASLSEIFMALLAGAALCLPAREVLRDPGLFLDYLAAEQITVATLPPAFLRALGQPEFTHLRTLITAGESAVLADVRHYAPRLRYFNAYGPTECSVCASMFRVPPDFTGDSVPIGEPLGNTRVEILDARLQLVPFGHLGEICVSGAGLARGYLHQPKLTTQHFVPHPRYPQERLYRTGDVGRWNAEGHLEFLGRRDDQVKIRGHRIELGEIEAQLLAHPDVSECVVTPHPLADGSQALVAYVVLRQPLASTELKQFLAQRLPAYAVPGWLVPLTTLPLTTNGKVDKRALPAPEVSTALPTDPALAPRNAVEQELLQTWEAILGRSGFGVRANFFDLGGDSIQAIQVINRLRRSGYQVEVKGLFLNPTVELLAQAIESEDVAVEVEPESEPATPVPLTAIQQWFFHTFGAARDHFNHSELLRISDELSEETIRRALTALQRQHGALRMRYQFEVNLEGVTEIMQSTAEAEDQPLCFEVFDLRAEAAPAVALSQYANHIQASLDLTSGPLMKVALLRCADGNRLLFVIHHLVVDGVSWRILLEDFCTACEQIKAGRAIQLPRKTNSFSQWAKCIQEYSQSASLLSEFAYWQKIESPPVSPLPRDGSTLPATWETVRHAQMEWNETDTQRLLDRIGGAGLKLQDHLLAALACSVGQWTESTHLRLALEGHGRYPLGDATVDVSRTVGWFTCVFPVVLPTRRDKSLGHLANQIQMIRESIPNRGLGYGILRYVTAPALLGGAGLHGDVPISFNYLGRYDVRAGSGLVSPALESDGESVHPQAPVIYDMSWNAMILHGRLRVVLIYSASWHRAETMERVLNQFDRELHSLIAVPVSGISA